MVSSTVEADVVGVDAAQVDPAVDGGASDRVGRAGHTRHDGVEERLVLHRDAELGQRVASATAARVHLLGDPPQALGAVVDGVHRGDHGEQRLGGADVAGGLLAADVLLAGLQASR